MPVPPTLIAPRTGRALTGLLLLVGAINLVCMPATFWPGDPAAWREESRAMLHGRLAVDSGFAQRYGENGQYFVQDAKDAGRWTSKYGIANALASLPPTIVDRWLHGDRRPGEEPDLLVFNLYQVVLTLLVCAALFQVSGRYTSRTSVRIAYVLAVMYATFLWYFQRAQSSEIYQVLFCVVWFGALVEALKPRRQGRRSPIAPLLVAWICAGLLLLCRTLYGLTLPVTAVAAYAAMCRVAASSAGSRWRSAAAAAALPAIAVVLVLAWVNWAKFGSPLLTGYHVWQAEVHWPAWSYWAGLYGLVFDMQSSVLVYFPVLVFALLATPPFARAWPADTLVMWSTFLLFFVVLGKTPSWRGGWTYGPRYILFVLPMLSLPFITWLDRLVASPRRPAAALALAATSALLVYSAYLTERQNHLDFFVHLRVSERVQPFADAATMRYFTGHHQGWISADLFAHRSRVDQLPFMSQMRERMPNGELTDFRRRLKVWTSRENYYWKR